MDEQTNLTKNGVIITVALRKNEATKCLETILEHTPKPRCIVMVHNAGRPDLDASWPQELADKYPEVIFRKLTPGQSGGMTAAWNLGFRITREHNCDAIICTNDDVYVNSTWPKIFDTIRNNPGPAMIGPVSNNPGVDYTHYQKSPGPKNEIIHVKKATLRKQTFYYCLNGFCWGINSLTCDGLISAYGEVLDAESYPWGGQEEDLGTRIQKMGGQLIIDRRCHVHHLKFSDWRTHKLYK